jgi:hypothetical protein
VFCIVFLADPDANRASFQWQPSYPSVESFLATCAAPENDSMKIRAEPYKEFFSRFVDELPKWREERLPGARAAQSTYDKVGLTRKLRDLFIKPVYRWLTICQHSAPNFLDDKLLSGGGISPSLYHATTVRAFLTS